MNKNLAIGIALTAAVFAEQVARRAELARAAGKVADAVGSIWDSIGKRRDQADQADSGLGE